MNVNDRITIRLGLAGGLLALVLLVLALASGGSQGMFQLNRPATDYAALLRERSALLRLDLGIDFVFLTVYAAFFLTLAATMRGWLQRGVTQAVPEYLITAGLAGMLITALLDTIENANILSMLSMAEQGLAIEQRQIAWQMAASQVKFIASYFGLFSLSYALPQQTLFEKTFALLLRWGQLLIGVAVLALPFVHARPFFLLRAVFFVVGLWTIAWIVKSRMDGAPK